MTRSVAPILLLSLLTAVPAAAEDRRALNGSFVSTYQDRPERLRAVFTPTGEQRWSVVFHFRFAGASHAYAGVAFGSLSSGELEGRAENESGARTFTFRGVVEDGRFEGTHFEVIRGKEHKTGKLKLEG